MADERFDSDRYSATGETLPYEKAAAEGGPELLGHVGGIKHYRGGGQAAEQSGSQFTGRLMPSAIHRPEERVQ